MQRKRVVVWAVLTLVLMTASSFGTRFYVQRQAEAAGTEVPESMTRSPQFKQFISTYDLIRGRSIWRNSPSRLLSGATNGMVSTLHDQFTNYLTHGQTQNLENELDPTYVGVGVEVSEAKPLRIVSVFAGGPAAKRGLHAGDVITAVDGHNTINMKTAAAMGLIHGKIGTQVTLTVKGKHGSRTVTLVRRRVALPTVYSEMMPHHIAYINIVEFGHDTGQEATQQIHHLEQDGARGILLDLRNDPGGEVAQALKVSNVIVPKGPVVTLKYKNRLKDHTYNSQGPGTKLPVVVLVNGNTASAAEILSAAIQERQGGILVGTKTYGKGIVQDVIPLSGGTSLKLTVAKYYTPDGHYIEHVGLKPNVTVPEPSNVIPSDVPSQDPQLKRALAVLVAKIGHRG